MEKGKSNCKNKNKNKPAPSSAITLEQFVSTMAPLIDLEKVHPSSISFFLVIQVHAKDNLVTTFFFFFGLMGFSGICGFVRLKFLFSFFSFEMYMKEVINVL